MKTNELLNLVQQVLEENKAEEIVHLDVHEMTSITDWMVICSATSKRHASALSNHLVTKIKAHGIQPLGVEGENQNEWLLVDLGDIVIHIMLPEIRKFYSLEKLWSVISKVREDSD
jgi:ribosome-associated protein